MWYIIIIIFIIEFWAEHWLQEKQTIFKTACCRVLALNVVLWCWTLQPQQVYKTWISCKSYGETHKFYHQWNLIHKAPVVYHKNQEWVHIVCKRFIFLVTMAVGEQFNGLSAKGTSKWYIHKNFVFLIFLFVHFCAVSELRERINMHDAQFANLDIQMAELDLRFQIVETASYDGTLLWKIRDYARRKQDAIQGRTLSLYSQPFYTHRYGYKMCARVSIRCLWKWLSLI